MKKRLILVMGLIAFAFLFWYLQGGPEKIRQQKTAKRLRAAAKAVDPEEKIRLYTSVIESDPKSAEAYFNRGKAWDDKGDHDKAIADYNKAVELDPRDAEAYYNRGLAYRHKGDCDKAIPDYTKAIELNPQLAQPYYNRGVAFFQKKDYDKAWSDVKKCQALGGRVNPDFLKALRQASGRDE